MKKNAFKIILFLAILFLSLTGLSYVMRNVSESKDRFADFYGEEKDSIEVLMLGTSTVGTSFIAPYMWGKYGFVSYPLSSNSQRPKAMTYLIDEAKKTQDPSLIVIELRGFTQADEEFAADEGHIREVVDNMRYSVNRIRTINALTESLPDRYSYYVDLFKYHSNYGALARVEEWKKLAFTYDDRYKGFQMYAEQEPYRLGNAEVTTEDRRKLAQGEEEVLRDLIAYLKENDLQALFVVTPRDYEEGYEEQMNYAGDIVQSEGFQYLDLNYMYEEMGFDYRTDFYDGSHTNAWGAVKCSDVLGQYITGHYELKMDYSESVIKEWDHAYDTFMEDFENLEPILKE